MNHKEAIAQLKQEVTTMPALNAALHLFALRRRARSRVTVDALTKTMTVAGFKHDRTDYEAALRSISRAGFGELEITPRGKVKALRGLKVTLRSLGKAVVETGPSPLRHFRSRNRFTKVEVAPAEIKPVQEAIAPVLPMGLTISLRLNGGRHLDINIPEDVTSTEVADLVSRLKVRRAT